MYNEFHEWFGTFIVLGFCAQPIFGVIHHKQFIKTQKKGWANKTHVWFGRALLILGIINGGLGFQLAQNTSTNQNVIYVIVVMLIALLYVGALIRWSTKGSGRDGEIVTINSNLTRGSEEEIAAKEGEITVAERR